LMGRKSRHVPGPEPRNTDLDGHINDTAPIQLYPFPSDATYFVVVRAVDIKGDYAEGYIRISVRDTPLAGYSGNETYDLADGKATLQPQGARDALDAANGGHDTGQSSWSSFRWTEEFPGNGTVEFTSITGSTDSVPNNPAQPAVVAHVCGAQVPVSAGGCDTYNAGAMAAGGHMLYFNITPLKVIYPNTAPYQLFILNKSDVTVMVEYKMHVKYDMNPWPEEYETQWGGP